MLKYLVFLALSLQNLSCRPISTPYVEDDANWIAYVYENGVLLPNDIVAFYQSNYPSYYARNKELMSLLTKQYENRVGQIIGEHCSFYEFSGRSPSSRVVQIINEQIIQEYGDVSFLVNGLREIDRTDKYLFNRIYKWYNFGYSDGFYLNIWSDADLFRKTKVSKAKVQSASFIIDCSIIIDEDIVSNELFYFDNNEFLLFKITVSQ